MRRYHCVLCHSIHTSISRVLYIQVTCTALQMIWTLRIVVFLRRHSRTATRMAASAMLQHLRFTAPKRCGVCPLTLTCITLIQQSRQDHRLQRSLLRAASSVTCSCEPAATRPVTMAGQPADWSGCSQIYSNLGKVTVRCTCASISCFNVIADQKA